MSENNLVNVVQIFSVFYMVFLGFVINSAARYKAFQTHIWPRGERLNVALKLSYSILIFNLLPLLLLVFWVTRFREIDEANINYVKVLIISFVTGLSLFGLVRIYHGILCGSRKRMRMFKIKCPECPVGYAVQFIPGFIYLILPNLIGWLIL